MARLARTKSSEWSATPQAVGACFRVPPPSGELAPFKIRAQTCSGVICARSVSCPICMHVSLSQHPNHHHPPSWRNTVGAFVMLPLFMMPLAHMGLSRRHSRLAVARPTRVASLCSRGFAHDGRMLHAARVFAEFVPSANAPACAGGLDLNISPSSNCLLFILFALPSCCS